MEVQDDKGAAPAEPVAHEVHHPAHEAPPHTKVVKLSMPKIGEWKPYVIVSIVYLLIALIAFAYVTINMSSTTTGIGGDAYLNLWDIWWVNYATFTLHTSVWSTTALFWPVGANLVYHTLAPLAGLLAAPFTAISIPFAYNSLFFIGFMLSGLTMYILADYFLQNKYAAFIAGLVFSFSASHIDHSYGLLIFTQLEWIPLALYFFIRMMKDKKWFYAAGLGICFMLATFMGNIEQGIMLLILLFVVLVLYVINKSTRHLVINLSFIINAVIAIVVCFAVGFWGFIPLIGVLSQPGSISLANINNTAQYNELWSADLLTFFVPSYYNSILYPALANSNLYLPDPSERIAYIGYTVIALALLALWKNFKPSRLWLVIVVVFASLSLGPSLLINGASTGIPTLYNVYHAIPGISVIREPGRFSLVTALGLAMLAAIGTKYILENYKTKMEKKQFAFVLCAGIALLYLLEVNGLILAGPVTSAVTTPISVPAIYPAIAEFSGNFSTLTLPALPSAGVTPDLYPGQATYYQSVSHRPIVGGLTGRENDTMLLTLYNIPLVIVAEQLELNYTPQYTSPVMENYTNETLLSMYSYQTAILLIDKTAFSLPAQGALLNYSYNLFGAPIYADNTTDAFVTTNAINNAVYRSYVSYPDLEDWEEASVFVNGTTRDLWVPTSVGAIEVYAPYANTSDIALKLDSNQFYYINTTMSFQAISNGGQGALELGTLTSTGEFQPLTTFNISTTLSTYSFNMIMPSGPIGSVLLFLMKNSTTGLTQPTVALNNITFEKR